MELISLADIQIYIDNWKKIRTNATELKNYLLTADSFSYTIKSKPSDNLHVYPGICTKTRSLYIFILDANMDRSKKFDSVIQCKVIPNTINSEPLPTSEALERIYNWQKYKSKWIDIQMSSKYGVFRAFNMPAAYMVEGAEYETFFSLKEKPKSNADDETEYEADLVTMRKNFYDVVRPVPPFGGGGVEESDFNL